MKLLVYCESRRVFMFTTELNLYYSQLAKAGKCWECGNFSNAGSRNESEIVVPADSANTSLPTVTSGHLKMEEDTTF